MIRAYQVPRLAFASIFVLGACSETREFADGTDDAIELRQNALTTCKTAGTAWINTPFPAQPGLFTITYDATPKAKPIDAVVGLSRGAQTAYSGFAVMTRFNTAGNIDARNGGAYAAATTIPYSLNINYRFRLVVDMAAGTYSAFVTPAGSTEKTIGLNFAFRTEQQGVAQLDSWGTVAKSSNAAQACGVDILLPQTMTINPVADAFVKDGTPGSNYGDNPALEVKTSSTAGNNRWTYLKFDLSGFNNITGARIRVEGRSSSTPTAPITTNVHAVSSTSWTESGITWNNKPALGSSLGSFGVINNVNKWYDVDVSSYVKGEKAAGRNLIALALKDPSATSPFLTYLSRENAYGFATSAPELSITTTDPPVKAPVMNDTIDPFLAAPASGAIWTVPVVVVRYLPTRDAANADPRRTVGLPSTSFSLPQLQSYLNNFDTQIKFALEEGTRFRGYDNSGALPSLGFKVIALVSLYEELPEGPKIPLGLDDRAGSGRRLPDYTQILTRIGAKDYVDTLGVKQFWIWSYQAPHMEVNESKMGSPTTGDVGNSWVLDNGNLPVFSKSYVVYNFNYGFHAANALQNAGHQEEAELRFANSRQDFNLDIFNNFVGTGPTGFVQGRCGDAHHPPNASADYDFDNPTTVMSDIRDWKPQGGTQSPVNNTTWKGRVYNWPGGAVPEEAEAFWHIYWRQSYPGRGNIVRDANGQYMTNWWRLVGDWDGAAADNFGLHAATPTAP